jgi:hypothetical protein
MLPRLVCLVALTAIGCGQSEFDRLNEVLIATDDLAELPDEEEQLDPYLRGGVALIRSITRPPDDPLHMMENPGTWDSHFAGRETFLARSIEEVGTVARLNCYVQPAGRYITEAGYEVPATRQECVLFLVDRSIPAIIHREPFTAPEPADTVNFDVMRGIEMEVPMIDVIEYLDSLPRRP